MTIIRNIVAATSILLVLIAPPAVVEGTCKCKKVCPNWKRSKFSETRCWDNAKVCWDALEPGRPMWDTSKCNASCVCNLFGCNCDGCEAVPGACGWTRRMEDNKEKEDNCADFDFFTSLSADSKRNLLADKYCNDDQVVREDIYEVLLSFALSKKYEGVVLSKVYIQRAGGIDNVLTCDLFNKSHGDVSHLLLCEENKHLVLPTSNKTGKKQKKN